MPARRWDDPWQKYPPSVPLPVEGGVATSRQRGPMATKWWSRRFVEVLESYGLGARMQRGRRYARTGQVIEVDVAPGLVAAQVQGSRPKPYLVTVTLAIPSDEQWGWILDAMRAKVGFVARLLDGEVPADLEQVFAGAGVPLFASAWADIKAKCTCPDWENPCKHIAAVLYVLADRLDSDPWLVLLLRGREQEELLDALAGDRLATPAAGSEVAPWWPFGPGPVPVDYQAEAIPATYTRPGPPDAVLDSMEALAVQAGSSTFVELLRPLYEKLVLDFSSRMEA
ncbi:MAG: SWIM zinc finger family protein [Actinomycetota bacterium]|nr:SWIM zinc finger family protein [Actinomycetota bacterium]